MSRPCLSSAGAKCWWDKQARAAAAKPCARGLSLSSSSRAISPYHAGWQIIDTGSATDLTTIGAYSGRFSAAGDGVLVEGDPYGFVTCKLDGFAVQKLIRVDSNNNCSKTGTHFIDEDAAARGFDSILWGITPQGQLFIGRDGCGGAETWVCDQQSAPNIDFSLTSCGIATYPWQLGPDELNGAPDNECPIE